MRIDRASYLDRQQRFAAQLAEAGFDGALVVSRGGFTYDRAGDVLYLSGHYQSYVYLPDEPPLWSGRAHCAFLINRDGETRLCVSTPEYDDEVAADAVLHGEQFSDTIADGLRALGLLGGRVALVGADVLPTTIWRAISAALDRVTWQDDDGILADIRRVKSAEEETLVREVCAVNRRAVTAFFDTVSPGVTEADAVGVAANVAAAGGAGLYFAAVSSGELSNAYTSSFQPGFSERVIRDGDFVRLDLCIVREGYYSDFGRTVVAGSPSQNQERMLDALHHGLDAAIGAIGPGVAVRNVVHAGDRALTDLGVSLDSRGAPGTIRAGYPPHWGHGLGLGWERPWMIESENIVIEAGMYLAIEKSLTLQGCGSVAAEQNLLVTENGIELLTGGPEGVWS